MSRTGRKQKIKSASKKINSPKPGGSKKSNAEKKKSLWPWIFLVTAITALCLFPMLSNGFTNWDDEAYVIKNPLLRDPDWSGIFTKSIVSNYHPLTIISLAFNYQVSELDPTSYLAVNFLLHLINTALVFYFIWALSDKKIWVAMFTALIFGIHPMHVESVAWISERKDVLYTLFFLLSLIQYWKFLQTNKRSGFWLCFLFFVLSLLSKPAAIVLPLVLFLLDYWAGRQINKKVFIEKIPFLIMAIIFAIATFMIQSQKAMTTLEVFPVWSRLFFACYGIMIYFFRFFVPYPLSAFHPYPPIDHLGIVVYLSPLFTAGLLVFTWFQRRNKLVVFGVLFYLINLLLVLQLVSIGYTIVSERYTYVPYIGLAFWFSMWLNKYMRSPLKTIVLILTTSVLLIFGVMTFERTKVWNNSDTLWTDVIKHYNTAEIPHTNRAYYFFVTADSMNAPAEATPLFEKVVEDCDTALKYQPGSLKAYETRGLALIRLNRDQQALADAQSLIELAPGRAIGYSIAGTAYMRLNQFDKAVANFDTYLRLNPNDAAILNKRGAIFYNQYQKYREALTDFTNAIRLNPQADYLLNRSRCYYLLGDTSKAREDVRLAMQKGLDVPAEYRKLLNL